MSSYLVAFRGTAATDAAADEATWGAWFQSLGTAIVDFGHRVGQVRVLSASGEAADGGGDRPTGYIVVRADGLEAAVGLATGCPILQAGGRVEVGEIF